MKYFTGGFNFQDRNEYLKNTFAAGIKKKDEDLSVLIRQMSGVIPLQAELQRFGEYKSVTTRRFNKIKLLDYLEAQVTDYAFERCKFHLVKGTKFYHISNNHENRVFEVKQKLQPDILTKVKVINGFACCSCLEQLNTGLPCEHEFLVSLKTATPVLIADRWYKTYQTTITSAQAISSMNALQ